MKIKTIKQIKDLKGKKVLLRVDFNVPLTANGRVGRSEDYRIVKTLPTISYLSQKGAKIIIMAHLGRPDGKVVEKLRLNPVAKRLAQLLKRKIYQSSQILGQETKHLIKQLGDGEILLLENIRFDKREEAANNNFAKQLAALGDLYVNDAFAVNHRDQASVSAIQQFLPSYAGLLLEQEILHLNKVLKHPRHPLVVIIGGAKISTKIKLIRNFLPLADKLILGGALANSVLKVMGVSIGKSKVEEEAFGEIKKIKLTENKLIVPVDALIANSYESLKGRTDAVGDVKSNEVIVDIGPDTVKLYGKIVRSAKTILWNGPMGLIETPHFAKGTRELIKILACLKAETIVGGGETVEMIRKMKLEDKFDFISTGGGAMLEYLEGKKLPGLKKLIN